MKSILVYTTNNCPYCMMAKRLLQSKGVSFDEVRVDIDTDKRVEMMERSHRRTVPQIFIGDQHVGGFDDLAALDRRGQLDPLLS